MNLQINQLTRIAPAIGKIVPVFDPNVGDLRAWSVSDLIAFLQTMVVVPTNNRLKPTMQYAVPSASAFSINVTDDGTDVHLIVLPTTGFVAGTVVLPAVANLVDGQLFIFNCTQIIGALTIDKNGAVAVIGAPSVISANVYFTLKYDIITQTWYRIG